MRLLYLTQWFDPEPNVIKGPRFVRALIAAGHRVTTVTGFPNYPTGRLYPGYRLRPTMHETVGGVPLTRLPLYPSHDGSSVRRALNFLSFFVSLLIYGLLRGRRHDLVYVYHPPITVGLAAALFGAVHRRRFVLEIQDLWPDTVVSSGMSGAGRLGRVLGALCDYVYRRAALIVVQSDGMRARLEERGVPPAKLRVIRNWADESALAVAPGARGERPFRFVYGGNLGRMQALDSIVRAAAAAERRGARLELLLYGDGIEQPALAALVDRLGTRCVRLAGRVSQEEIAARFSDADALVVHLLDDPLFHITIPSKTQYCLAAGKPILAGLAGEAADLLRASGAAIVAPPQDEDALTTAMLHLCTLDDAALAAMGEAGRAFYRREFGFDAAIAATLAAIDDAAARR